MECGIRSTLVSYKVSRTTAACSKTVVTGLVSQTTATVLPEGVVLCTRAHVPFCDARNLLKSCWHTYRLIAAFA